MLILINCLSYNTTITAYIFMYENVWRQKLLSLPMLTELRQTHSQKPGMKLYMLLSEEQGYIGSDKIWGMGPGNETTVHPLLRNTTSLLYSCGGM